MITTRHLPKFCLAGLLVGLSLASQARVQPDDVSADIRRTTYGVPHILASNEQGLGYGIGYAYAQDNLCLLADEIVTVNGERSKYFGPHQLTVDQRENLTSDLFFTWLNVPRAVNGFWQAQQPEVRQLIEGYVQGYNRALAERSAKGLPEVCQQAAWLRPITVLDMVKLTRRLLAEGGAGQFAEALAGASPPTTTAQRRMEGFQVAATRQAQFALERGSNAVAIGAERSFNGRGMLLANPHFPWVGGMRFYQMHLTIPGKLDVMGVALPGLPMVNIGFNQHLAWTHTVDTSRHFTLHRLKLDPKNPTHYLLDGQSLPMTREDVTVTVKGEDGQLRPVTRTLYGSAFGPVVQWPGRLDWSNEYAYSLRDANLENDRVLQQWYAMNRADSLKALQQSIEQLQGIPWVNTLAADDKGQTLYLNQSVVPYVDASLLAECSDPAAGLELIVLDGSRSACNWKSDPRAAQAGIFPAQLLPHLQRSDFVQNSNDSAWMVNPAQPLRGFSPVVSREDLPLGPRSRFALERLSQMSEAGKVEARDLQRMVMDDKVYLADLVVPDLLQACGQASAADAAALQAVCSSLRAWDRTANLDTGLGLVHLQNVMQHLGEHDDIWRVPFDPADPQHTPRGIDVERAEVGKLVREAILASAAQVKEAGLPATGQWGSIQVARMGRQQTPIHGGPASLGVYNAIQSVPAGDGTLQVVSGTSYLQLVTFDEKGPNALGLLAFSQSSEPQSRHSNDQTQAFSRKQWSHLPFTEQQIKADPHLRRQVIKASDEQQVVLH